MDINLLKKRLKEIQESIAAGTMPAVPGMENLSQPAAPQPVETYNPPEVNVPTAQPKTTPASTSPVTQTNNPAVNIPKPTAKTTSNKPKVDPKTGAAGAKAFDAITTRSPQFGEEGMGHDGLIDAYNSGLNGEDMSRETRDNAAAGGYLEQLEAMYNAGLQDAKPVETTAANTPSVDNTKVNTPSINPAEDNTPKGVDNLGNLNYTSGNTTFDAGIVEGPEYTDTAEHYGAPKSTTSKTTADLIRDLEYLKDMMYLNGAINSTDSTIQNVYRKITDLNYDASKEESIDEIYEAFYNLMKGVTNDQIARSNKIAVGTNKNSLFDKIYDKTAISPKFNNTKDTEENINVGQAGRYALDEISKSSPEIFVNKRKALSEAYKDGFDGKALTPDKQKEAEEGKYLDEVLRIYQAGKTDGQIKAGNKDIDKLDKLWHIKHDPSPWEKDYEYLSYVLTHCGAKNSKDPNVKAAYQYFMDPNNQGKQIPQDILDSSLNFANTVDKEWINGIANYLFGKQGYDIENIATRNNFFSYPTAGGRMTQGYHGEYKNGKRQNGGGIDIGGKELQIGSPVYAVADGTVEYIARVVKVGDDNYYCSYGVYAKLTIPGKDGGTYYLYAHLDPKTMFENGLIYGADWQKIKDDGIITNGYELEYSTNDRVEYTLGSRSIKQGQIIGFLGNSGNSDGRHLHFGYFVDGKCKNIFGEDFLNY